MELAMAGTMFVVSIVILSIFFAGIHLGYKMAKLAESGKNPVPAVFKRKAPSAKAYTEADGRDMDENDTDAFDPLAEQEWEPEEIGQGL